MLLYHLLPFLYCPKHIPYGLVPGDRRWEIQIQGAQVLQMYHKPLSHYTHIQYFHPWVSPGSGLGAVGTRPVITSAGEGLLRFFSLPSGTISCRSRQRGWGEAAQFCQGSFLQIYSLAAGCWKRSNYMCQCYKCSNLWRTFYRSLSEPNWWHMPRNKI